MRGQYSGTVKAIEVVIDGGDEPSASIYAAAVLGRRVRAPVVRSYPSGEPESDNFSGCKNPYLLHALCGRSPCRAHHFVDHWTARKQRCDPEAPLAMWFGDLIDK